MHSCAPRVILRDALLRHGNYAKNLAGNETLQGSSGQAARPEGAGVGYRLQ